MTSRSSRLRPPASARRNGSRARCRPQKKWSSTRSWRWRRRAFGWRDRAAASSSDHILRITGGAQLAGSVCVSGSKNAALPEMAAALLTSETVTLSNVPKVRDTYVLAEILRGLGGSTEGEGTVSLNMAGAQASDVPAHLGRRMRATIVLLGALLGRFGRARLPRAGGDDLGG